MHDPQPSQRHNAHDSDLHSLSAVRPVWTRLLVGLGLGLGMVLSVGSPLWAGDAPSARWNARAYALWFYPENDEISNVLPSGRSTHSVSDGGGLGLDLEFLVHRKLGIEVAALVGDLDTEFRVDVGASTLMDSGEIGVEAYTLGLNYHLTPNKRADIYVGAFAAMIFFDDIIFLTELGRRDKLTFDDDTGIGLKLGIDVPFTGRSRWSFNASVRYVAAILEGEAAGQDLDFNPLIPAIGFGLRF